MYAYLDGKFTLKSPAVVWLDVNGIGFEVNISLHTYSEIHTLNNGRLFTHLMVKEDGHTLFGFSTTAEKEIFQLLISVSGVGAATARMMLSSLKPDEVIMAIIQGNSRLLESVKGIGKKTAERLVLELKDKVSKAAGTSGTAAPIVSSETVLQQDALNALMALGIAKNQAEQAIRKVFGASNNINHLEDLIKQALKAI